MSELTRRDVLRIAAAAGLATQLPGAGPAWGAAASKAYDDGNTEIPGGLTGDPTRVIIVGAGWAGLTLANALRAAKIDHVVLEGRDRVGGRANTVDLAGFPVELGCAWIHQPIGNPMTKWARQVGVRRRNGDVELDYPLIRFFDGELGRDVGTLERLAPITQFLYFAQVGSADLVAQHGPGLSVEEGWNRYAAQQSMSPVDARRAAFMTRGFSEMVYGRPWGELSLAGWSWGAREGSYLGVGEGNFPVGGYRTLYGAMAGDGEVRFGHRVRAIERGPNGVVVRARRNGRDVRVRGSHVVVTVPLGVLKAQGIRFTPELPPAKRDAIAGIGFGAIEKVILAFDKPFWSDLTHTHILHIARGKGLDFPWWIDMNRTHGVPALVAFNGGPFAAGLHGLTTTQRKDLAWQNLTEIMGRRLPAPVAWRTTDWLGDRFARGGYSAHLAGRTTEDHKQLSAPVDGRLLFAGEATSHLRHSTADGAFSSGVREAKRLLRASSVKLTA